MSNFSNIQPFSCKNETDLLTGALSKSALVAAVEEMTANNNAHAFILLDLDGFKQLNNTLGHVAGNQLLVDVVNFLRKGLRRNDIIGRIGGDEFFICISNISDLNYIHRIAKHICVLSRHPLQNGGISSASLGIVRSPHDGISFDELYTRARSAVRSAKKRGGNCYVIYDDPDDVASHLSGAEHGCRSMRFYDRNWLVTYDCNTDTFRYNSEIGAPIWELMEKNNYADQETIAHFRSRFTKLVESDVPNAYFEEYLFYDEQQLPHWYRVGLIYPVVGDVIAITFTDIQEEVSARQSLERMTEYDELTGLTNRSMFCRMVEHHIKKNADIAESGVFAMIYFDVIRFKAINDMFGMAEGDRLLIFIADTVTRLLSQDDIGCRIGSDRFVAFVDITKRPPEKFIEQLLSAISMYYLPVEITFNAGIYIIDNIRMTADAMLDRAILAQSSIKGSYTMRYHYYDESLRDEMLTEQEIVGMMAIALNAEQFVVHYQPQYNHSTGMIAGAEALVRWMHPERGLISPGLFIPIFERNGFITKLDLYVFEHVCRFVRKCIDSKLPLIPISVNFSRHDIYQTNFAEMLEELRLKYDVPVRYLRLEITESAIMGGSQHTNEIIRKLHDYGYIVEMDDFGSGYSSLNVLKDIELDIIKLDMNFLAEQSDSNRGGTILSSIVRMAKWLCLPVIAEGVETVEQADFLRSIGCDCVQGFLYSRPLPEEKYEALISGNIVGAKIPQMELLDIMNACDFWNPKSQETLIFSNYVGGAAIFDYHNGKVEVLRVNKKYLQEIGMNLSEKELIEGDPMRFFDEHNKKIYLDMLERAMQSGEEEECETWRNIVSSCCGTERICIRSSVRMIGQSGGSTLFYGMIRNITAEKQQYADILESERRFKIASEQINIYYWEYTIATKEMRPCFRCMRDLGLPPLLTNYPEPAIERGIFPPEVADMYRDWHRQVAEGVEHLEAIIPLTPDRIPFRVRYTTEFDENGLPVKAYGSAALIVQ
ncbi:MAG: bifunctional diguanylate cyclase/phosphodiesterase [Oscillospiraceae bacterium]|nr:bifunctional diguanylate cyclase/phosphodiesterase [Oscillospiraceae bacterium]